MASSGRLIGRSENGITIRRVAAKAQLSEAERGECIHLWALVRLGAHGSFLHCSHLRDYVAGKLALYRKAHASNLILCVDEARNCAEADLPPGVLVVQFRRRVDPAAVLRAIRSGQ